jgi:hypothetical protein
MLTAQGLVLALWPQRQFEKWDFTSIDGCVRT